MKHYSALIIFLISFTHSLAQPIHVPDQKAKQINDNAVTTFLKYSKNTDSAITAIRMLEEALTIDSNYLNAWNNKLGFECQLKQYDDALTTAKRIIRIFPDQAGIIFFSGILEFKTGKNDDAIATFNRLINIYNAIPDTNNNSDHLKTAQLNKGIALKLIGKEDEGKQTLVSLSMKERDLVVRRHISAYINKSKEDIINEWLLNGPMTQ